MARTKRIYAVLWQCFGQPDAVMSTHSTHEAAVSKAEKCNHEFRRFNPNALAGISAAQWDGERWVPGLKVDDGYVE